MEDLLKELVELTEAIDAYEYLEEPVLDEEILTEALQLHIRQEEMAKIFQIPIGKIFATLSNADIFPLMREYNRKLSDYKITGKDAALTINKMKIFIFINGTLEEKELLTDKLDSLEKKIASSYRHKSNETIDVPYGSVRSIYSLYKRIEKRSTIRESAVSDAKLSVKLDPDEFIINDTLRHPTGKAFLKAAFKGDNDLAMDIAQRRVEKAHDDPDLEAVAKELKRELKKHPVDHIKAESLLDKFKALYRASSVKRDVDQDMKVEKIESKRKVNQLYEQILEEYIDKFSSDFENDNNIERINFLLEQTSKEV